MIEEKSFEFALKILKLVAALKKDKEFIIADQLLKCGTSIGANVSEAGAGQSKKDFIAKMSIASKEARETRYWLRLINEGKLVNMELNEYIDEIDQIIRMLTKIVKTSQSNI